MEIKLSEIKNFLSDSIIDIKGEKNNDIILKYLKNPSEVDEYTLDWINNKGTEKQLKAEQSKAKVIITDNTVSYSNKLGSQNKVLIFVANPKLAIAKVGNHFFKVKSAPCIHPTAIIHPQAIIGNNVFIGPYVSVGACSIGNNVEIHGNTIIGDNVTIKNEVIINSNVILGAEGLGCERESNGNLVTFPHFGGVIIEELVELGSGTIIAKGALSETRIGRGSKLNVNCFVAHNVKIGANAWISPKVNIAGSVNIGDNVTIFSGAIIREQLKIGNTAIVGMGSVVTKNIPDNETWIGNPAKLLAK
jgi:UDP-3-O-[3-hydroxymyristoyl] glucosamine N-acyltransferase